MKKHLLTLLICLCCALNVIAQAIQPTTPDEYSFGTVGYKIQLQTKLPMKKGYSVTDYGTYEEPDRTVSFAGLLRDGEQKPCAIIMVYTKKFTPPEYFCLPTIDAPEALWDRYYQSLNVITDNPQQQLQFMMLGMGKTLSKLSAK